MKETVRIDLFVEVGKDRKTRENQLFKSTAYNKPTWITYEGFGIVEYESNKFACIKYDERSNTIVYEWQMEHMLEEYPNIEWSSYEEDGFHQSEIEIKEFDSFKEAVRFIFDLNKEDQIFLRTVKTVTKTEVNEDIVEL